MLHGNAGTEFGGGDPSTPHPIRKRIGLLRSG